MNQVGKPRCHRRQVGLACKFLRKPPEGWVGETETRTGPQAANLAPRSEFKAFVQLSLKARLRPHGRGAEEEMNGRGGQSRPATQGRSFVFSRSLWAQTAAGASMLRPSAYCPASWDSIAPGCPWVLAPPAVRPSLLPQLSSTNFAEGTILTLSCALPPGWESPRGQRAFQNRGGAVPQPPAHQTESSPYEMHF